MKLFFHNIKKNQLFLCLVIFLGTTGWVQADNITSDLPLYPRDAPEACDAGALQIRVNVKGVYKQGLVKLDLYNSEDGFLDKKGRLAKVRVAAKDGPMQICFNVKEPGRYAVAGYHDLDADRKFDKKWNFAPKEPYALSQNPDIKTLRLPKFDECAFDVGADGQEIDLIFVDPNKE